MILKLNFPPQWSTGVASAPSPVVWTAAHRPPGSLDSRSAFWLVAPGRYLMSYKKLASWAAHLCSVVPSQGGVQVY